MKHWIVFLIVTTLLSTTLQAQTGAILGTVTNDKKIPLAGATVTLMKQSDSTLVKNAVTGTQGNFRLSQLPADSFIVSVTSVGYRQYISFVTLAEAEEYELGDVVMAGQDTDLGEVVLVAKVPPVVQRGDTAQYNASQFKVNPDANAEDLY